MVDEFSEQELAQVFISEISFYRQLEKLRQSFCQNYGKSVYQLFRLFDCDSSGRVSFHEIHAFLQSITVEFSWGEF